MKTTRKLVGIAAIIALIGFSIAACGGGGEDQTPTAADFNISGTGTFSYDGNPKTVTVTAKEGKTSGAITVKYNGNSAAPSAAGTYAVTFDVAAASGWKAASGLSAGTLAIYGPFDNINDLGNFLSTLPANTAATAYTIVLNVNDITDIKTTLNSAADKYVYLDLSGSTITEIQEYAFCDTSTYPYTRCSTLTGVTIPNGVTSIGNYAFSLCGSLTSVTISNSVTSIGERAFLECTSLASITVGSDNPEYASVDGILYNKAKTALITVPLKISGNVTIPNGVTVIGQGAFQFCYDLTSVTIPNSVTSIGESAFQGCTGFTNVTIPDNVTVIGRKTFQGCTSLTGITIPNGVTTIQEDAFFYCTSLTGITIPNSVTVIGREAFVECTSLASVTFEGTIDSNYFGSYDYSSGIYYSPFYGDLSGKFYATDAENGTPGTYTTTPPVNASSVWSKQ